MMESLSSFFEIDEETREHASRFDTLRKLYASREEYPLYGIRKVVLYFFLECLVILLSFFPVGIWFFILFFAGMAIAAGGFTEFLGITRNVISVAPLSEKGNVLFRCHRSHVAAGQFVLFVTFFLIMPYAVLQKDGAIMQGLLIWVVFTVFLYAALLFFLYFFMLAVLVVPWYLKKRFRNVENILVWIGVLLVTFLFVQVMSIPFMNDIDSEGVIKLFSWSPVSAPFFIPLREAYFFVTGWEITIQVLLETALMFFVYVATFSCYLKLEMKKVQFPRFPSAREMEQKLTRISVLSKKKSGEDGGMRGELLHFARINPRNAEKLRSFKFSKGAEILRSFHHYSDLKSSSHGLNAYLVMVTGVFFLALILIGVYVPQGFFIIFAISLWLALCHHEFSEEKKYVPAGRVNATSTYHDDQSWLKVLRMVPDTLENIQQIVKNQMKEVRSRRVGFVLLLHSLALPFIFLVSYEEGIKIPFLRFFLLFLVMIPLVSFSFSRLSFLFKGKSRLKLMAVAGGFMILLLFNLFIYLIIFFTYWFSYPGYALFFGVNLGVSFFAYHARQDVFDTIFNRVNSEKRRTMVRSGVVLALVLILAAFSFYRLLIYDDLVHMSPLPGRDKVNYNANLSDQYVEFEDDVIISTNVSFENCSLFFADDYYHDILLYVMEGGKLTIRNSTLDANYRFHFWVEGDVVLDNVTIDSLYGSTYTFRLYGGLIIWGNATILNSTIRNSGAMGIMLHEGTLTMKGSHIIDSHGDGIKSTRSRLVVENCSFKGNGKDDISLDDSIATVVNSSFYHDKDNAITHDDDSKLVSKHNMFQEKEVEDVSWLTLLTWTTIIVMLLTLPGLAGKFMNDMEWRKLYEMYGIQKKK